MAKIAKRSIDTRDRLEQGRVLLNGQGDALVKESAKTQDAMKNMISTFFPGSVFPSFS